MNCLCFNLNTPVWLLGIDGYCENSGWNDSKSYTISFCSLTLCFIK